jgi:two-component system sensor kinase FixL
MPSDDHDQPSTERQGDQPVAPFGAAAFIFLGDRVRYVNPAAEAMTGYSAQELYRIPFGEVIAPEHREQVRERDLARQRGAAVPSQFEVMLRRKTGEVLWTEFSAGIIEYEGEPAVLGIAVDITERRAAAARLREADRRLHALIENSSDAVLVADADYRLRYIGPAMERFLGVPVEEMLGDDNLDRIHPDDQPAVRAAYGAVRAAPGRRASATYRIRHRDGSWRWFESIGTNLLDDPAVAGIIINTRDVTDQKRAEEQARQHQIELAHVLRRRTMGEMAAVFAHEVNQPLTAILNYATGSARRVRSGTARGELLAALDEIAAQALRAGEIIRRLRGFVRKSELHRQLHQLNDIAHEAIQFVAGEAADHGVQLGVQFSRELPPVDVDAVQIEQVILNLLRNALDATYECATTPRCVTVATARTDTVVELAVSDTGDGIAAEVATDLFEPFVSTKRDGLGMGLSICRSIVAAHGGELLHAPNPDRGVTFRFTLPLRGAA